VCSRASVRKFGKAWIKTAGGWNSTSSTTGGGVQLVKVQGAVAPPSVLSVTVVEVKPDGEFFYDFDG
jgi:hypothetical protein